MIIVSNPSFPKASCIEFSRHHKTPEVKLRQFFNGLSLTITRVLELHLNEIKIDSKPPYVKKGNSCKALENLKVRFYRELQGFVKGFLIRKVQIYKWLQLSVHQYRIRVISDDYNHNRIKGTDAGAEVWPGFAASRRHSFPEGPCSHFAAWFLSAIRALDRHLISALITTIKLLYQRRELVSVSQ